jgi:hypothetical protein
VAVVLLGGGAYFAVGAAINSRAGRRGLAAVPHLPMWLELKGLVEDGVALSTGVRHGAHNLFTQSIYTIHRFCWVPFISPSASDYPSVE